MVITLDVGNTNIVLGGYANDTLKFVSRIATETAKTEDQYAIDFANILKLYHCSLSDIDGAIISTVVPQLIAVLKTALDKLFSCKIMVVSAGIKTGLDIKIDDPGSLGSDLVAAAVGALKKYPVPCIIFDLGTATTITALDKNNVLIGGSIMPGVKVSLGALSKMTAQLPFMSTEFNSSKLIGTTTIDSMKSGLILGTASMMDGMIERYKAELGENSTVIATGGLAHLIVPHCKKEIIIDETLLLDGLYIIYNKNK